MTKRASKPVTVLLSPEQEHAFVRLHKLTGREFPVLLNDAISLFLRSKGQKGGTPAT